MNSLQKHLLIASATYLSSVPSTQGAGVDGYSSMTSQEFDNLEAFMKHKVDPKGDGSKCPTYGCSQESFEN